MSLMLIKVNLLSPQLSYVQPGLTGDVFQRIYQGAGCIKEIDSVTLYRSNIEDQEKKDEE